MAFLDPNCLDLGHADGFTFRHHMSAQNPFSLGLNGQQQQALHRQQQQLQQIARQQQQQQQQQQAQQAQSLNRSLATGKKGTDVPEPMETFPFASPMYFPQYGQPSAASAKRLQCTFDPFSRPVGASFTPPPPSVQYMPWGTAATDVSGTLADKTAAAAQEAQRKALALPLMTDLAMSNSTKYAYKPAGLQELYMWYITRQQLHLRNHGHRAIVENLVIYLEGLKVNYRDSDISLSETSTYGHTIIEGGPLPHQAFRDNLVIETNTQPSKTCSFIIDSVVNFLHTGTLGSLCMMETISSYFIPIHSGDGLAPSEIYEADVGMLYDKVGYKKLTGGYKPGECGSLTINSDGTYTLKSYGIILVIGLDFVASAVKPVFIERLTTSSIRLLHPNGNYSLPKHVLRYKNRPIGTELTLPTECLPGTNVSMRRVHC